MLMAFSTGALLGGCADKPTEPTAASTSTPHTVATSTSSTAPPTTTPTSQPRGTSPYPPGTPEHEVATAYIEAIHAVYNRIQHPDPNDPSIFTFHTGNSLRSVIEDNRRLLDSGQAARLPPSGPPDVFILDVKLQGSSHANVKACYVDATQLYEVETGEVLNADISMWEMSATMILEGTRWLLSENLIEHRTKRSKECPDSE